jgi:hypothetical protein
VAAAADLGRSTNVNVSEDPDRVMAPAGCAGLTDPHAPTVMGRIGPDADRHDSAPAGQAVLGPPAPARGAPAPGPAVPDELTDEESADVEMYGQEVEVGEG